MRIITGLFRSRQIVLPSYFTDRPTTDMAKESLFNIISNNFYFGETKFLDLFSGSGGISYEMASRGCQDIVCVDINKKYCDFISKNFKSMYPQKSPARVINTDAFKFIQNTPLNFDLIFADPPYDMEGIERIPEMILSNPGFPEGATLIIEHSKKTRFTDLTHIKDQRHYGKVNFSFYGK
ncbi:MAG: 16S rRNA (guanine(966)-N(2))-methyltransferase RsmD [Bacteroidales bacterium]|nr:16S rRNA (guanine(966)-N(2))-methyltransferase RsmD [Bacteroidales bacterium]MBR6278771.1 16S rRNA (guanine(966)-N(2))-methyltransferase RsmD [Bacteroidales bacterium]